MWRRGITAIVLTLCAAAVVADSSNDRRRLSDQPRALASTAADVSAEIQFGRSVAAHVLSRHPLYENDALNHYVSLVGHTLAASSGRSDLTFHFAVLDTDLINAYAAPGGYIFVTRGALAVIKDEAELAAVLAHEIAHVSLKHIVRAMNIRAGNAADGLSGMLSGISDPLRAAFSTAVDQAMSILFQKGLDQSDEFAADQYAFQLLALTGYDPSALENILQELRDRSGALHTSGALNKDGALQTITSTHPAFTLRIDALRATTATVDLANVGRVRLAERFLDHVKLK